MDSSRKSPTFPASAAARARRKRQVGRSERTFLSRPTTNDGRELRRLRRESWAFLEPWEPAPAPGNDPAGAQWLQGFLRGARRKDCERLLLCRWSDGEILGQLGFSNIVRGAFHSAYLGYWIGAAHTRQGYMSEGLNLALEHAFRRLELHRVEANIIPENVPSLALVKRAGFRMEGLSPRYLRIAGDWRDHQRWALLCEDWEARARTGRSWKGSKKA